LNAAQERMLARRIEQGAAARERLAKMGGTMPTATRDELRAAMEEGRLAKETFICCNLRLVASVTRPFRGQGLDLPDLLQEGMLGLIRAVEKFDHHLGYKFSTYATWWIRQSAQRALADKGRIIRLPVHVHELVRKIFATERRLSWELEHEPTVRDIADRLGEDPAHVAFVMQAARSIVSLDAAVRTGEEDSAALLEFIAGTGPSVEQQVLADDGAEQIAKALDMLSYREAQVLRLRFGLDSDQPQTLDEVGRTFNVTRERVRQIQDQALKKLRSVVVRDSVLGGSVTLLEPQRDAPAANRTRTAVAVKGRNNAAVADSAEVRLARLACLEPDDAR